MPYTQRHALTTPFAPSEAEQTLYEHISAYLQRDVSYGFPQQQKHLVALVLRKLLASSTVAVVATLQAIRSRLQKLLDTQSIDEDWLEHLLDDDDLETDLLDAAETRPSHRPIRRALLSLPPLTLPCSKPSWPSWTSTWHWPPRCTRTKNPTPCSVRWRKALSARPQWARRARR